MRCVCKMCTTMCSLSTPSLIPSLSHSLPPSTLPTSPGIPAYLEVRYLSTTTTIHTHTLHSMSWLMNLLLQPQDHSHLTPPPFGARLKASLLWTNLICTVSSSPTCAFVGGEGHTHPHHSKQPRPLRRKYGRAPPPQYLCILQEAWPRVLQM